MDTKCAMAAITTTMSQCSVSLYSEAGTGEEETKTAVSEAERRSY